MIYALKAPEDDESKGLIYMILIATMQSFSVPYLRR